LEISFCISFLPSDLGNHFFYACNAAHLARMFSRSSC
jgi:hypothetical protein